MTYRRFPCLLVCASLLAVASGCATAAEDIPASADQNLSQAEQLETRRMQTTHVMLGATSIQGSDNDTIAVGSEEGLYDSLTLRVVCGAPQRNELIDAVSQLALAALTAVPNVAAASRVEDVTVGARLVATLLCADTYMDLIGPDADPDRVDMAVAKLVSSFITG